MVTDQRYIWIKMQNLTNGLVSDEFKLPGQNWGMTLSQTELTEEEKL